MSAKTSKRMTASLFKKFSGVRGGVSEFIHRLRGGVKVEDAEAWDWVPVDILGFSKRVILLCPVDKLNKFPKDFYWRVQAEAKYAISFVDCRFALDPEGNIWQVVRTNSQVPPQLIHR